MPIFAPSKDKTTDMRINRRILSAIVIVLMGLPVIAQSVAPFESAIVNEVPWTDNLGRPGGRTLLPE